MAYLMCVIRRTMQENGGSCLPSDTPGRRHTLGIGSDRTTSCKGRKNWETSDERTTEMPLFGKKAGAD